MAKSSNNTQKLHQLKQETASEVGVTLKQYNGDLPTKEAGRIGGNMVRKMVASYTGGNMNTSDIK